MTPAGQQPRVTAVIPCRNEEHYIGACLDSLLTCDYPQDRLEILVADGMSDDGTRAIVREYAARHPGVHLLDNPKRITPAAMNVGVRHATGAIIMPMGAHALYPPDYVTRLVAALAETGADNVGGVLITEPADGTPVARALAIALSHPLGVGNSYFRIGATERRVVDTVPFGCYPRAVFDRIGLFDEDLIRNQDDELNGRLVRQGGRIVLIPEVVSRYYARRSFRQVARMFFQYGYFKPLAARKIGRVLTVRQLVPAAFVLALGGSALLAPWSGVGRWLFVAIAAAYLSVVAAAATAGLRYGVRCALALAAAFPVLHVSYGVGFLAGLWPRRGGSQRMAAVPLSR